MESDQGYTARKKGTDVGRKRIGIRREDKHEWESRVPITPAAVSKLMEGSDLEFVVQSSEIRIFSDEEYRQAGAIINEDLGGSDVVFAVKEIPQELFEKNGVYVFFSHTIKGQKQNMPILRQLMDLGCTLLDYERIVDAKNRRLVFFGRHAGLAGMVDTLWLAGHRLQAMGHMTPFLDLKLTHEYGSLAEAKSAVTAVGKAIEKNGIPSAIAPFICGFAGYGNVSQGAQEIYDLLPVQTIEPDDLERLTNQPDHSKNGLFKVVFKEENLVTPKNLESTFVLQDYYDTPKNYRGTFEHHVVHLSLLVNGIYWTADYPRLLTKDFLRDWYGGESKPRLIAVGDISCDIEGAVESTVHATTPGSPAYVYDPMTESTSDGWGGFGLAMMTTDCLPCELSRESSETFTEALMPYVTSIAHLDTELPFEEVDLPPEIKGGLILWRGELTPHFQYLNLHLSG